MLPVVGGGVCNMIFVKSSWFERLKTPMDKGRLWRDGKPLLGQNKTWKGFWGMTLLTGFWMALYQLLYLQLEFLQRYSILSFSEQAVPVDGMVLGALWGLGWVLFELPNSFIKRRIDIDPGKNAERLKGAVFTVVDQVDSMVGIVLVTVLLGFCDWAMALVLLLVGSVLHYVVNVLLYFVKLKKQAR